MIETEKNENTYVLGDSDGESRRLERQAALYGGTDFLGPFLEAGPRAILDAGCGSGVFGRHVARACPAARVVGLERDEKRLAFARAQDNPPNLDFVAGDLMDLDWADGQFDLVFNRFVMVHLGDPDRALAEMVRVTAPGGRVVCLDMIHDGIWFSPPKPALSNLLTTTMDILRGQGAEPNQGLHLPVALRRVGLRGVEAQVLPNAALSGDPEFACRMDNWRDTVRGLAATFGDRFEAGLVEQALAELDSGGDQFLIETAVLAHGQKC